MVDGPKRETTPGGPAWDSTTGLLSAASVVLILAVNQLVIKDEVIDNGGREQWWHLAPALLFGAPYVVMAWQALRVGSYATYQFARSQAVMALIAGIPLSLLAFLNGALSMGDRDPVNAMFAVWTFTALQVALLVVTRRATRALASTVPAEGVSGLTGIAPVIWACVAFLAAIAVSSHGDKVTGSAREDSSHARNVVMQTAACLIDWRQQHGQYPEQLATILSEGCAPRDISSGKYAGHTISYRRDDAIGFALLAVPDAQMARDKVSQLADGSGRVYSVHEGLGYDERPYLSTNYDDTEQAALLSLVRCLVQHAEVPDGEFPERLDEVAACAAAIKVDGLADSLESRHYRLRYLPKVDSGGHHAGFELEVRPKQYGDGAIRSYWADDSQIIRGTGENRAATADDPEVFGCELSWGSIGSCDRDFLQRGSPLPAVLGRVRK